MRRLRARRRLSWRMLELVRWYVSGREPYYFRVRRVNAGVASAAASVAHMPIGTHDERKAKADALSAAIAALPRPRLPGGVA